MKYALPILIILVMLLMAVPDGYAQCAMCKGAAEASLKEGNTHAAGLNSGILYLLIFPYLLAAVFGILWYKRHKAAQS